MKAAASILKSAEGGPPLRATLVELRARFGVKATREESPYIGHVGIALEGPARAVRRALKFLNVA